MQYILANVSGNVYLQVQNVNMYLKLPNMAKLGKGKDSVRKIFQTGLSFGYISSLSLILLQVCFMCLFPNIMIVGSLC